MIPVIELDEVRKEFPGIVAVEETSLEIQGGEFFTLLGPSGSGKTTLLNMIAGLEKPTDGGIILDGVEVTDDAPYNRDVNTVFQNYALFPHMSVAENVGYGLEIRGWDDKEIHERVKEMLELVDLEGHENRSVQSLSGGEQQRIALARALAIEPAVLLLDEPLGALDEKLRQEMQVELKEIQEQLETTFVYVTHDQEEALSMSDRIAVINGGEIIQTGPPEAVYKRPRTPFVASFFHRSNVFSSTVEDCEGETVTVRFLNNRIQASDPDNRAPDVGATVDIFVQPEEIELSGDQTNAFDGTITNKLYRGSLVDYTVCSDGTDFLLSHTDDSYTEGEMVTFGWGAEDTILLE